MSQAHVGDLFRALSFAASRHRDQRRKGAEAPPYINHPIQVAEVLATVGQVEDLDMLMAAVLHDTVEDTTATLAEIRALFGDRVADYVAEVTDDTTLPKLKRKARQVHHAPQLSAAAKQIKIADKICNVSDIVTKPPADWSGERRREYVDWAELVVAGCRDVNPPLDDCFDRCIAKCRTQL